MTTRLLSLSGGGKPFSPSRLAVAAGRICTILLAIYLIHITRQHDDINLGLALSVAVFAGLYLAFGRKGETRPVILYIIATSAFAQIRMFGDQTGMPIQYQYVIDLDVSVFGVLPNHWLQDHFYTPGIASPLAVFATAIYLSYFLAFQVAAFVIWVRNRAFFAPYASAIVIAAVIGLLTCYALPTAPPWLAAQEGQIPEVHRVVEQLMTTVDSNAYDGGTTVAGDNQVAAMPSLHMGLTMLVVFSVWRFTKSRLLRGMSILYAASMAFALVFLGEHYVTDEFFGVITAAIAWKMALRVWSPEGIRLKLPQPRWRQRPQQGSKAGV